MMMNNNEHIDDAVVHESNVEWDMKENLTAIHVMAQLMCRQSEGRQTYPIAKSLVMLTQQALDGLEELKKQA